jgi:hypothetical protein
MTYLVLPTIGIFTLAVALVPLALVFDALDGRVARWCHAHSALGRELDSLADAISFGVARLSGLCGWHARRLGSGRVDLFRRLHPANSQAMSLNLREPCLGLRLPLARGVGTSNRWPRLPKPRPLMQRSVTIRGGGPTPRPG